MRQLNLIIKTGMMIVRNSSSLSSPCMGDAEVDARHYPSHFLVGAVVGDNVVHQVGLEP